MQKNLRKFFNFFRMDIFFFRWNEKNSDVTAYFIRCFNDKIFVKINICTYVAFHALDAFKRVAIETDNKGIANLLFLRVRSM